MNCYAAGIFFATCILHMLPEISEKMKNEILKGQLIKNNGKTDLPILGQEAYPFTNGTASQKRLLSL